MGREPIGMDELVEHWTVLDDERDLVLEKRGGAQRLGFALVLKFYTRHGRFPRGRAEFSDEVVEFVARQVKVSGAEFGLYEWQAGRSSGIAVRYAPTWGFVSARWRTRTSSRSG